MVCKKKSVENGIQNKLTSVKSNFKISTGIWPSVMNPPWMLVFHNGVPVFKS